MAQDKDVISHIDDLIAEEHQLRERRQRGDIDRDDELDRLRAVETELDRCWDLLRQRRALRDAGSDPDAASARPADQVEGYLG
ncbi:DUF2630 family protein [Solicola gregarius]|uniref:DUF2630 family protein n=1 Tax=Solicola gregarius TaxID=2908642 RepID=A0AA46TF90_9ACTN|nr:DUF2630 family protein [Solicola gregarius]UYM04011.1 DUF2630 family protein [Solicola gregarius]